MEQSRVILITLVAYKALLIAIGLWASRRTRDATDFFLGGRRLGPWVAGLSYAASTSSAWVLLGYSAFVFSVGLSALWMAPGVWLGYAVIWLWIGPRLRRESADRSWLTPSDFLSAGVGGATANGIRAVAAAMIVFCFVFYIAAQFDAAAKAFTVHFPLPYAASVVLGAAITLIYCLLGGFWAASVTDTLQGAIMGVTALALPVCALVAAGGWSEVMASLAAVDEGRLLSWTGGRSGFLLLGFVLGLSSIGLGTLGQPHLLSRLMAVRGERARRQGFLIAIGWGVSVYIGMTVLALSAHALGLNAAAGEALFYEIASAVLPPVVAGLVVAAVLAAVMSTVDSILLSASAAVAHDLGLAARWPGRALAVSRLVMVTITALAVALALGLPDTIFNRVLFAWSALGAAFGPVVVARVAGREPSAARRLASMLTGFALTVLFYAFGNVQPTAETGAVAHTLSRLAALPGDPFERLFPWLVTLAIVLPRERRRDGRRRSR